MTPENEIEVHRREVIRRIRAAVEAGASDLISILARCEGADPILVKELYDSEFSTGALTTQSTFYSKIDPADPRISLRLPAPDPATCQWWFTSNAIESLSEAVEARAMFFVVGPEQKVEGPVERAAVTPEIKDAAMVAALEHQDLWPAGDRPRGTDRPQIGLEIDPSPSAK